MTNPKFHLVLGLLLGLACATVPTSFAAPEVDAITCSSGERRWTSEPVYIVDGDTYDLRIDLGLGVSRLERIRLLGLDTPEVRGAEREAGEAASQAAEEFFETCPCIIVSKGARGKYGRLLADVENRSGQRISTYLRERGHEK